MNSKSTYNPFKRKTITKGFSNHKSVDEFIQNSLDKYHFVDPHQDMYEATGLYSQLIVSNKSAIPDLVIWNKKFNKNECFVDADTKEYNAFPRLKFILKAKAPASTSEGSNAPKLVVVTKSCSELAKDEDTQERRDSDFKAIRKGSVQIEEDDTKNNEEEDPLWGEVDVSELKNVKVKFQALPGKEGPREGDESEEDEKTVEKIYQVKENVIDINQLEEKIPEPAPNFTEKVIDNNSLFDFTLVFTHDSNKENASDNIPSGESELQVDYEKKQETWQKISQNDLIILGNPNPHMNKPVEETQDMRINKAQQISDKEFIKVQQNIIPNSINPGGFTGQIPMIGVPPFFVPPQNVPNHEMLMRGNMNMNMNMMGIPMSFPASNMNFNMAAAPNQNNLNQMSNINPILPPFQRNEPDDEEEDEDTDKFIGNMNLNYNNLNPTLFLEDPGLIIQKNLLQRGWFIMSKENKILGNFNSWDLLNFLEDRLRDGTKMNTFSITDYETDIYFTPSNLYEILRDTVPRLMEKIMGKKKTKDISKSSCNIQKKMMVSTPMLPNTNQRLFNCFQGGFPSSQVPQANPMVSSSLPNYNINVQYVKNDININSFGYQPNQVPEINANRSIPHKVSSQKVQGKIGKTKKQQ